MNPNNPEDRPNHTPAEWRRLQERITQLEQDIDVGKAFHDLAVAERNKAWQELEELKKDRAEIISGYFRLSNECSELRASEEDLKFALDDAKKVLKDYADAECVYGDDCPDFGSRHGQCSGCKARKALEKMGG